MFNVVGGRWAMMVNGVKLSQISIVCHENTPPILDSAATAVGTSGV